MGTSLCFIKHYQRPVTPNVNTTCLSPGLYDLRTIIHPCSIDETCFEVLVNNEVVFNPKNVLDKSSYSFSIMNDGTGVSCNEGKMLYVNLRLDRYPGDTSFQLINKDTSITEVYQLYSNIGIITTSNFAT